MSDTKSKVQKLYKIGLIVCKFELWCSLIVLICCGLLLIAQLLMGESKPIGEVKIVYDMFSNVSKMNVGVIYTATTIGIIISFVTMIKAKLLIDYFKKELEIGTPFDMVLVNQLRKTGKQLLILSLLLIIVCNVIYEVFAMSFENIPEMDFNNMQFISTGCICLIFSLLCRLAVEKDSENNI